MSNRTRALLIAVLVTVSVAATPAAAAVSTDVETNASTNSLSVGETATIDVVVTNGTEGVGSYGFTASSSDNTTLEIVSVSLNGNPSLSSSNVASGNGSATVSAASVQDTNVSTVATVTVQAVSNGTADVTLSNVQVGYGDGSDDYDLGSVGSSSFTVGDTQQPTDQVNVLEDGTLTPNTVDANTTVTHDLSFDVENVSGDGNTDTISVTLPAVGSITSANSLNVTDANGSAVAVTSSPSLADANGGTDNQLVFSISPESPDRDVTVDANFDVAFDDLSQDATGDVTVEAVDSTNGQDTAAVASITVEAADEPPAPTGDAVNLEPATDELAPGETATFDVVATNTSQGVGSYGFDVNSSDASVLSVDSVSLNGNPSAALSSTTIASDNSSASVSAAGVADTNVSTLATVTVTANAAGSATLSLSNVQVGFGDGSDDYNITSTGSSDVTVANVTQAPASVTFDDQTVTNGSNTVTVESATLEDGGFVVIHSVPVVPDNGTAADSVVGNSEFIADNASDIQITLDEPITANTTLVAMAHRDTDGDQAYNFPELNGTAVDGPYTFEGAPVVDSANITVEAAPEPAPASVTFDDQTVANGSNTVTVANAELSEGGFVVIHTVPVVPDNGTAADSVVGNSEFIADNASDIQITLDEPITANTTLVAMAHRDTDGDQAYNFPELNGTAVDGPYVADGAPVVDSANITVQQVDDGIDWTGTPIEGATSTDDDPFPEDVNADGEVNLDDVFTFAFDAVFAPDGTFDQTQLDALDYNGDGTVDLDDVFEFAFGEALA